MSPRTSARSATPPGRIRLPRRHCGWSAPLPRQDQRGRRLSPRLRRVSRSPVSPGYWGDEAANAELFTNDGWVLLGDIVEVEDHVHEHPSVAMVAAVGVPDAIFGERLCVMVTLEPEAAALTLEELTDWLRAQGTTREYLSKRMVVVEEMPWRPGD